MSGPVGRTFGSELLGGLPISVSRGVLIPPNKSVGTDMLPLSSDSKGLRSSNGLCTIDVAIEDELVKLPKFDRFDSNGARSAGLPGRGSKDTGTEGV